MMSVSRMFETSPFEFKLILHSFGYFRSRFYPSTRVELSSSGSLSSWFPGCDSVKRNLESVRQL